MSFNLTIYIHFKLCSQTKCFENVSEKSFWVESTHLKGNIPEIFIIHDILHCTSNNIHLS